MITGIKFPKLHKPIQTINIPVNLTTRLAAILVQGCGIVGTARLGFHFILHLQWKKNGQVIYLCGHTCHLFSYSSEMNKIVQKMSTRD